VKQPEMIRSGNVSGQKKIIISSFAMKGHWKQKQDSKKVQVPQHNSVGMKMNSIFDSEPAGLATSALALHLDKDAGEEDRLERDPTAIWI
jgi:hypothetical protein